MKPQFEGMCPLCGRLCLRTELYAHMLAEGRTIREATIKEIAVRHHGWVYELGACQVCWETHRALSQDRRATEIFRRPD